MGKPYRVAIVGHTGKGDFGHGFDEAFSETPETKVVAVCDENPAGLKKTAAKIGVDQTFTDYRAMLDQVKPDILAVGLRWVDKHAEIALAAAERNIHLYVEKPFCRTIAEANQIIAACERTHTRLVVCHPTRFSPVRAQVANLLKQGKIGRVLEFRGRGKEDHRGGGEDLWVLGTHLLDLIRSFAGLPTSCYASIRQNGKPVSKADVKQGNEGLGPLAGDWLHATYELADGGLAYFNSVKGMGRRDSRYGLQIFGSDGVIEILEGPLAPCRILLDPSWTSRSPAKGNTNPTWQPVTSAGIGVPEPLKLGKQSRHTYAIKSLLDAIEQQKEPDGGMYENRDNLQMIMAVFESHRQGKPVKLPLTETENPLTKLA